MLLNFDAFTLVSYPHYEFTLMRDIRQRKITGKVGRQEIEKLNHAKNGCFHILQEADRIELELLAKLIDDINNKDLLIKLETALETFLEHRERHWLIDTLIVT